MVVNVADDDEMRFPLLHTIASILAWMSAVVNPFIYAFKNRQYQQAFTKVTARTEARHSYTWKKIGIISKMPSTEFQYDLGNSHIRMWG